MSFQQVQVLLFVAAVVSMLCRRLRLPYTVGLTCAGFALALLPITFKIELTKELIFSAFLPPLIFEAAYQIRWKELKADAAVIGALATLGVLLSVATVMGGLTGLLGWPAASAFGLAALISATDPVSVIATFKEAKVTGRLKLLVEAESLFNDGTAAVLFAIALAILAGGPVSPAQVAGGFALTVLGGAACGALTAGAALLLAGSTQDHLVEVIFTSLAAYASFLVAEQLHFSGVLATLTAGIILGNSGSLGALSERARETIETFWETIAFIANSLIFLLIGFQVAHSSFSAVWLPTLAVIVLSLAGRVVGVYVTCGLFARSRLRVDKRHQHLLVWGGLRGALALALALGLPEKTPFREVMVSVTFGVVAFSVIVQGLSVTPILRRLKLVARPAVAPG